MKLSIHLCQWQTIHCTEIWPHVLVVRLPTPHNVMHVIR